MMEASGDGSMFTRPEGGAAAPPLWDEVSHYRRSAGSHHHYSASRHFLEHVSPEPAHFYQPLAHHQVCACHACTMARLRPLAAGNLYPVYPPPDSSTESGHHWNAATSVQEQVYQRDYVAGRSSPHSFTIHTPLRRDSSHDTMHNMASPPSVSRMRAGKSSPQRPYGIGNYGVSDNQIAICKWYFVRVPGADTSKVSIGGYILHGMNGSELVQTGPVIERLQKSRVRTSDGKEVILMGAMDVKQTVSHGFSDKVAEAFFLGFPVSWRNVFSDDAEIARMREAVRSIHTPVERTSSLPERTSGDVNNPDMQPSSGTEVPKVTDPAVAETQPVAKVAVVTEPDREASSKAHPPLEAIVQPVAEADSEVPRPAKGNSEVLQSAEANSEVPLPAKGNSEVLQSAEANSEVPLPAKGNSEVLQSAEANSEVPRPAEVTCERPQPFTEACEPQSVSGAISLTTESDTSPPKASQEIVVQPEETAPPDIAPVHSETAQADNPDPDRLQTLCLEHGGPDRMDLEDRVPEYTDVEADECAEMVDNPSDGPAEQAEKPGNARKRSNSKSRRIYKKRKGRGKKLTGAAKETSAKRQRVEQDPQVNSEEPAEVDKADGHRGSSDEQALSQETTPASTKKRARRSLPPPLPAPRVKKDDVIEAYGLKTSRSGRLLVPPLAYWRNQTLAHDKDGGIIAIFEGFHERPSDTGNFIFKPPTQKKAVKLQEKLCAAAETPFVMRVSRSNTQKQKQQQKQQSEQKQQQQQEQQQQSCQENDQEQQPEEPQVTKRPRGRPRKSWRCI